MEWQPIETAPDNDERVLLCWDGIVVVARRRVHTLDRWDFEGPERQVRRVETQVWWEEEGDHATSGSPTHWMPLPAPPKPLDAPPD